MIIILLAYLIANSLNLLEVLSTFIVCVVCTHVLELRCLSERRVARGIARVASRVARPRRGRGRGERAGERAEVLEGDAAAVVGRGDR